MRFITLGSMFLASVLTFSQATAQKVKKAATAPVATTEKVDINKVFKNWKPRNIGPASMSGRVTTIDAEVANPNHIWIGAASGGVWKTYNGGVSWTPVFDEQPILNIGALAIQQSNPSVVWVGTGEGNPRNSISIGEGIYKTMDAGRSWKRMGLEQTRNIHRVIIDPTNPNTVYAGAIGNPYGQSKHRGVYKTTDGGETWNQILFTNDTSGPGDMIMDPSNPNKLFVAMWHHYRNPYHLESGGKGSGIYMTIDGGKNFVKLGKEHGLPDGDLGRVGITISRSNPNVVYALVESKKSGLYKSDDGGYSWKLVNGQKSIVDNRPFYFQDIIGDPLNENTLWYISQTVQKSIDGGKSFETIIPYSGIHPDHHAFWIHPTDNKYIIDGNDGGIGITRDGGKTWMFDEKIPVGQFYHINVDNEIPYHVMGGMQDNGSWRGPAYTTVQGGIRNFDWDNLWGGDGFDVMPDPEDANWVYAMSQGGNVGRYNTVTGQSSYIKPPAPDAKTLLRFNWNASIAQDPFDKKTIYFGSQFLHKSTNKGAAWEIISPDLTSNDSAKIDQRDNGGLSIDITGAENHCTIICIAPSAVQKGLIYIGTDDGKVQMTANGGATWTDLTANITGLPKGAWIPQIRTSATNPNEVFVVVNNYRQGDFAPYIFRSNDAGKTWTNMVDAKKVTGYALTVLQDPTEPNLIFVGTEQGMYVSIDNGVNFQQWKNGYPSVSTYDFAIQEREADLAIATFGRSLWVLDDIRPLRKLAKAQTTKFFVSVPPASINLSIKNSPYEWSTWGMWDAPNKPTGMPITIYSMDTVKKAKVQIKDANDNVIRNLNFKLDTGFNRNYWGFEQKGKRAAGAPKNAGGGFGRRMAEEAPEAAAAEEREFTGREVLPGTYKVVVTAGAWKDSAMVQVSDDPRVPSKNEVVLAQDKLLDQLQVVADKYNAAQDQLDEAELTLTQLKAEWKDKKDKGVDSLNKAHKAIAEKVKNLKEMMVGKRQEKQGYGTVPTITPISIIRSASMLIMGKNTLPGAQEERMIAAAKVAADEVALKVNAFFAKDWADFRKLVEATPIKKFKEVETIK
ncbi:MAG: hypothetical protein RL188_887 [Bacteroidota bacterium]|jgi:photosystem II stability/assembly factor-like uncharacterized protein